MRTKFALPNGNQRKYLSGLAAISCVAWASPVYSFLTTLHLHSLKITSEYVIFLIMSFILSVILLVYGYYILEDGE